MKETERRAVWEGGKERDSEGRESTSWERQAGQQLWPGHRGPLGLGSPAKAHRSLSGPVLDRGCGSLGRPPAAHQQSPLPASSSGQPMYALPAGQTQGPPTIFTHTQSHIHTHTYSPSLINAHYARVLMPTPSHVHGWSAGPRSHHCAGKASTGLGTQGHS